MIDTEKYKTVLAEGLMLDHFSVLCSLRDGQPLLNNKRVNGFLNLLCKKGYVNKDNTLSDKALNLIGEELIGSVKTATIIDVTEAESEQFDYAKWIIKLHKTCEEKLLEMTGKRQIRDKIDNIAYSFLPNSTDLGRVILKAVNLYKLKDFNKIEKTILVYIERCAKARKWFPILGYYIMKNGMSTMVTDMGNLEEIEEKNDEGVVNI